jgi:hypothetical protein
MARSRFTIIFSVEGFGYIIMDVKPPIGGVYPRKKKSTMYTLSQKFAVKSVI